MNSIMQQSHITSSTSQPLARSKLWIYVFIAALHVGLVLLLYQPLGGSCLSITPLTAALTGWMLGLMPGVLFALVITALNVGLLQIVGAGPALWSAAAWPSGFLGLVTGMLAGLLSELLRNIKSQAHELALKRDKLEAEILEKRKAEDALRDSESALLQIFHGINDGVVLAATTGEIRKVNDKLLEMYGFLPGEIGTKHLADLCTGMERQQLTAILSKVRDDYPVLFECQSRRSDALNFDIEVHARKLCLKNEETVVLTIHDISERKQAEEQLRESYRQMKETQAQLIQAGKMVAVGQLATGIAHEINNPLAVISSSAEILRGSLRPEWLEEQPLATKHLRRIDENVQRCKSITQALLQFARNEKDVVQPVEMRSLIVEALRFVRGSHNAGARQIKFVERLLTGVRTFQVSDSSAVLSAVPMIEPLMVEGNPRQLQQVVLNLMVNAIDATESGGSISLTLSLVDRSVQIEVADTGEGIPPEHLEKIFEPFFTTKPSGKGTGLGLYLCHSIVLAHHGSIEVQSELGKGTLFKVRLPLVDHRFESGTRKAHT